MTRRPLRRASAAMLGATLALSALTACVPDVVEPAVDWLAGRQGVAFAEVVATTSTAWSSSGSVRGELAEDLADADLERLVDEVLDYMDDNESVSFRLGVGRVDFLVLDDGHTDDRVDVWRDIVGTEGLAAALVLTADGESDIHARAHRDDARAVVDTLAATGVSSRLGLFRDAAALEENWRETNYSGDDPAASTLRWNAGCDPAAPGTTVLADLALDLGTRDDVAGGWFGLCEGFWIEVAEPEDLATRVPALRAELDADERVAAALATGLDGAPFPVTLQSSGPDTPFHVVAVTPADPAAFPVLAVLEDPAGGDSGLWELRGDASLTWNDYDEPTADLVARLAASPASTALSFIEVGGQGSTVGGAIGELPALLEQADALDAAAASIGNVHLAAERGGFGLTSEGLDRPDVMEAVSALRASGLWVGRTIVVRYLSMELVIVDGALQPLEGYTDPSMLEEFVEAWKATDSATTP